MNQDSSTAIRPSYSRALVRTNVGSSPGVIEKGEIHMTRILVGVGLAVLLTSSALAQLDCDQVRQAVATYGYAASKQYALAHYGREVVAAGEKCLKGPKRLTRHTKKLISADAR